MGVSGSGLVVDGAQYMSVDVLGTGIVQREFDVPVVVLEIVVSVFCSVKHFLGMLLGVGCSWFR